MGPRLLRQCGSRTPPRRGAGSRGSARRSGHLHREPELLVAAGELAVELLPERLLERPPERTRLRDARLDEVVTRDLEPHALEVREVAQDLAARCAVRQRERERLRVLAV